MMCGKEGGGGEALSRQVASDPTQGDRQSYHTYLALGGNEHECYRTRLDANMSLVEVGPEGPVNSRMFWGCVQYHPPAPFPPTHAKNEESVGGFSFTIAYPTRT